MHLGMCPSAVAFYHKQELLGSSPQKKKERAWRDGWHAARELGARGVWMGGTRLWSWGPAVLDGWHVAQELGARGVWMGGTRPWSWRSAEFGWVARSFGRGPRSLDGWHAALEGPAEFGWVARRPRHEALELGARTDGWRARGQRLRNWGSWGPAEFGWVAGCPRF